MAANSAALAGLPRPNMIMNMPEVLTFQIGRDDGLITLPDRVTGAIDEEVLYRGVLEGYRVFVPAAIGARVADAKPELILAQERYPYPLGEMAELQLSAQMNPPGAETGQPQSPIYDQTMARSALKRR